MPQEISADSNNNDFDGSDSADDPIYKQFCEFKNCKHEIFAACVRCEALLCWNHFDVNEDCKDHGDNILHETNFGDNENLNATEIFQSESLFVRFAVDGEQREVPLI